MNESQRHQQQPVEVPVTSDSLRRLQQALEAQIVAAGAAGVLQFNGRSGNVSLSSADVIGALGFTPVDNVIATSVMHVQDQKAAGTDAGTFTQGAWQTRVLNTVVTNNIAGASLSGNQITLPAGTYDIEGSAPGHQCEAHQTRLQNITDGATTLLGTTCRSRQTSSTDGTSDSTVRGRFTIAGTKVLELQHRCQFTMVTSGLGAGVGNSWGTVVFAEVFIRKVA